MSYPNLKRLLQQATPYLRAADEVLGAVHNAREGSTFSRALAVAAGAGSILRVLVPYQTPQDNLRERGYKPIPTTLGAFFCRLLMRAGAPAAQENTEEHERIVFWDKLAAVYHDDRYLEGPFALDGKTEHLASALANTLTTDMALACTAAVGTDRVSYGSGEQQRNFELVPMQPAGVYMGEPGLQWFVDRLKRHGSETRSMLLVGPTGVGKSTLARLIAQEVKAGKLLKVSSNALRECSAADLVDLVSYLRPNVLLLDDLTQLHNFQDTGDVQLLEILEAIHGRAKLVIGTLMTDNDVGPRHRMPGGDDDAGTSYYGGCRPGRVDEIVKVKRPSPRVREQILRHYFADFAIEDSLVAELVEKTEGLTGAYLREVAHRLKTHGTATWKSEVASIKAAAPIDGGHHRMYRVTRLRPRRKRAKKKAGS